MAGLLRASQALVACLRRIDRPNDYIGIRAIWRQDASQLRQAWAQAAIISSSLKRSQSSAQALQTHNNPQGVANWVVNELARELKDNPSLKVAPAHLGELVRLVDEGTISGKIAKDVLGEVLKSGEAPGAIVEKKGLKQISDPAALAPIVEQVLAENPDNIMYARNLASIYVQSNNPDSAKAVYGRLMGRSDLGPTRGLDEETSGRSALLEGGFAN